MNIQLSDHSIKRGKERLGLSLPAMKRMGRKALLEGKSYRDFKKDCRVSRYLYSLYAYNRNAGKIRIYGQHIYLFSHSGILITILHLPNGYKKWKSYLKPKTKKDDQQNLQTPGQVVE